MQKSWLTPLVPQYRIQVQTYGIIILAGFDVIKIVLPNVILNVQNKAGEVRRPLRQVYDAIYVR